MIRKVKTNRELENEKQRGKKRYLERVAEEHEAEKQIKEFKDNEDHPDESGTYRFDGLRSERH